jgi:hypothetical protein
VNQRPRYNAELRKKAHYLLASLLQRLVVTGDSRGNDTIAGENIEVSREKQIKTRRKRRNRRNTEKGLGS